QLVEEGKLVGSDEPDLYSFAEDVSFRSPSAAAAVVNAGNMNGRSMWKVADSGETYQAWYDQRLPNPESEAADDSTS
ncbi:MAG TPA: DUF4357 domain-containing protein, partial [Pirellulales bacterium]|nr:DUF4357 domain-containing protein [Pirellulales bacterium]